MTDKEKQAATRAAVTGSGDNGKIWPLDVYEHFGYEDDGFPTGQYTTEYDEGLEVLERMLSVLDKLRTDRKLRIVIDCDPEFPFAMMRFWGTYKLEIQTKLDAADAERAKRYGRL